MTLVDVNNEQINPNPEALQALERQTSEAPQARMLEFDGNAYETNLPEGVNPFSEGAGYSLYRAGLNFAELNQLPVGEYWVKRTVETKDEVGRSRTKEEEREISILNGDKGPVIAEESLEQPWGFVEGSAELMRLLGYQVEGEKGQETLTGIPTPDTVKSAAALLGIDIEYHSEQMYIPSPVYVKAYAEGKYPVSVLHYKHDVEDDHLTGLVLGGETLKEALTQAAQAALKKGGEAVGDATGAIDNFTATLRSVVTVASPLIGEAYGAESGRRTLMAAGERLGLAPETTEAILAQAQQTAKTLGMEVNELK